MIIAVIILLITFLIGGYYIGVRRERILIERELQRKKEDARTIIYEAERKADSIIKEAELKAKDMLLKSKLDAESEINQKKGELENFERKLRKREENLEKKAEYISLKEREIEVRLRELKDAELKIEEMKKEVSELREKASKKLEEIAKMSQEEAKKFLLNQVKEEMKLELAKMVAEAEAKAKEEASKKAINILALALQRQAAEYVYDNSVSVVPLPSDEMKGRIIGREGRNIRAFEAVTGVDVIVDDTPEAVIISCPNPLRREIARRSLEKLISDGRIHPGRIEEIVAKTEKEVEQMMKEAAEKAVLDLNIGDVHPEIKHELGKLKFRFSYAQNVFHHSLEVAYISGIIAAELRLNEKLARRAGLLHDIGKAADHEVEGTHTLIGYEIARRNGEPEDVCLAIKEHHDDNPSNIYGVIVQVADTLSAARPGARREMYETFVKRIEELEKIASSFPEIEKAYAIQAGREVRVIVNADRTTDDMCAFLAREIAKKIQENLKYPGEIKVVVIREKRMVEYAR